jgi:CDP-4-dehydro-6-deoxyglucose reductase
MKSFEVRISSSGRRFIVNQGESVLTAALRQGVMLPYSCKNGTCGSCKGSIDSGTVHYPFHPPFALEQEELDKGFALMCQAEPASDLDITVREISAVRDIEVRMLPARVIEKTRLAENVVRVRLKLPRAQRLQFLAGQYIDILLPGGKRRAFSIASCPSLEDEIELHVRHVDGGGFTGWVFDDMKEKDIIRLEGPLGTFFVRNDLPERPIIMMGGGTGFAPLKSMMENLLEHGDTRPVDLYWGARDRQELYLDQLPKEWADKFAHIRYRRAVSDDESISDVDAETSQDNVIHAGFVHEAVLKEHPDLSGFDVYMSGPPAMIDAAKHAFIEHGLPEERLFYDSFEFGLDVPVRVLTRPH